MFATELFQTLATDRQSENVIISPVSVQLALGLAYYGAEGRTATELQKTLHASAKESKDGLAESYHNLLHSYIKSKTVLEIANKVYTRENLKVAPHFREVAEKYFDSEVEGLNFNKESQAVQRINNWVKEKTQDKIDHVVDSLEPDTNVALINAIYFKARWARPFNDEDTKDRDFWLSESQAVQVPTMFADNWYYYADYPELDAKAIELFFENINMTMWFILPNKRTGLQQLEQQLKGVDFKQLEERWQWQSVSVYLPKFQFEFDTDLKPTLSKVSVILRTERDLSNALCIFSLLSCSWASMQCSRMRPTSVTSSTSRPSAPGSPKCSTRPSSMSTRLAARRLASVVSCPSPSTIESGPSIQICNLLFPTDAAGVPMSLPLDPKTFVADHPFVFIIRDKHAVYFTGHIVKF